MVLRQMDLPLLVEKLSALKGLKDLCLTTNGALLSERIQALKQSGLRRVNISIDTLDAEKFKRMTKRGDLNKVLEGIFAAKRAGLAPIKLNAVVERGVNDDDIMLGFEAGNPLAELRKTRVSQRLGGITREIS